MINYSIIIPHHNIPDLLQRCLDSIPDRDDLEIIIVDDNSSSEIVDFSNFPGTHRKNCHVFFDKEGGGAGHARNLALKKARGKRLIFSDADDFFMPCFNDVLDASINIEADVIYTAVCCLDTEFYTNVPFMANHIDRMLNTYNKNKTKGELLLRYRHTLPWAKIIKRDLVEKNNIHFDETIVANDVTFSYMIGYYAKKIKIEPHAIYCYTIRQKSLSRIETDETNMARVYVMGRANLFFREKDLPIKEDYQYEQLVKSFLKNQRMFYREWNLLKNMGYSSKNLYYNSVLCFFKMSVQKVCRLVKRCILVMVDE